MADHVQLATKDAQDKIEGYTSGLLTGIEGYGARATTWLQELLDRYFPQRAAILAKIQEFVLANPKISTFPGMNIALTGIPLGIFVLFSFTIAVFSLIVGVGLGLLAAGLFSMFFVGAALAVVFPIMFFTTMAACFLFLWGLGGYHVLKWLNGGVNEDQEGGVPLLQSGSIGDSLNSLTGGRLTGFIDTAKAEKANGDITGFSDQHTPPDPPPAKGESSITSQHLVNQRTDELNTGKTGYQAEQQQNGLQSGGAIGAINEAKKDVSPKQPKKLVTSSVQATKPALATTKVLSKP